MASILMALGISIDDYIIKNVHCHLVGAHGYAREVSDSRVLHGSAAIHLSVDSIFTNPLMQIKFIAKRFILFYFAVELYLYWAETVGLDYDRAWAESFAETWVKQNM